MNPKVDFYFIKNERWQDEINLLRTIVLSCGLEEELKWGVPTYRWNETNIVLIHVFKEYCALLFFKGALLIDTENLLVQQTENVQAARQLRFTNKQQIIELEATIKAYLYEAIEVEKAGLKVALKKTEEFKMVDEFKTKLDEVPSLKEAFYALTPGRQRAYMLHFASAKQAKTRQLRVDSCIPQILVGKGLND